MTDGRHDRRRTWLVFLIGTGFAAALGVAGAGARPDPPPSPRPLGEELYLRDCAVCHGSQGEGTTWGPEIATTGLASVDFQLRTGRMPISSTTEGLRRPEAPEYTASEIRAIVGHTRSFVDAGPGIPAAGVDGVNVARGGELYRFHCAGCHGTAAVGGALVYADQSAPGLTASSPIEVIEAMLTGPGDMPVLAPDPLDANDSREVAAYVLELHSPEDRGGLGLWHLGPVPEGAVGWIVGLGGMLLVARWIGTTVRERRGGGGHG